MVQIHGKGRYKIIANKLRISGCSSFVVLRSINIRISVVVDHRLVSKRGGISDRGGHLVVSISDGGDSLLSISHGSGIGHGGPVDGVSISHGVFFLFRHG